MECRRSLRFDALLQRLRLSVTMRVRLAPGTAVDPTSPVDSDSDSNFGTLTSDSTASISAHNPYDEGHLNSDSDSDGGVVVRTVTVSMALADARVASTLLLAVLEEEALALQVCDTPLRPYKGRASTSAPCDSSYANTGWAAGSTGMHGGGPLGAQRHAAAGGGLDSRRRGSRAWAGRSRAGRHGASGGPLGIAQVRRRLPRQFGRVCCVRTRRALLTTPRPIPFSTSTRRSFPAPMLRSYEDVLWREVTTALDDAGIRAFNAAAHQALTLARHIPCSPLLPTAGPEFVRWPHRCALR
jgi:hypothetical protein